MDAPYQHEKAAVMNYIFQRVDPASYIGKKKSDDYLERAPMMNRNIMELVPNPPKSTYQTANSTYRTNSGIENFIR